MTLKLAGKFVLVTGAPDGIGRRIALDLAANGAFVILNSRSISKLHSVVEEIKQKGGDAIVIAADVSKVSEIKMLFEEISELTSLDMIVHNVAMVESKPISDVTEDDWERNFHLNAKESFFVLQAASKAVVDGGRIIVISGSETKTPRAGRFVYNATKEAVEQIVRTLALEVAPRKVSVNIVSPGYTLTNML